MSLNKAVIVFFILVFMVILSLTFIL